MTPPSIPFAIKKPFTLVSISQTFANTAVSEIIVTELLPVPERLSTASARTVWRYGVYKRKGKRKQFYLDIDADGELVFAGHGVVKGDASLPRPQKPGSIFAVSGFSGNACFNLGGTVQEIQRLVDELNLNRAFKQHDAVLAIPPNSDGTYGSIGGVDDGIPVFPEIPSTHAVVLSIREKHPVLPQVPLGASVPAPDPFAGF